MSDRRMNPTAEACRTREVRRRIVANVDFEMELARDAALRRGAAVRGDAGLALPSPVIVSVSALATLLRAFAREDDRLWTPAPVSPTRLPGGPGLPLPELESGRLERLSPCESLLAWGESPSVARLRAGSGNDVHGDSSVAAGQEVAVAYLSRDRPLHDLLWEVPPCPAGAAVLANHRGFCLETARSLGIDLPGAVVLESASALERHLAGGGAAASRGELWVLKAPYSAAGRSRLRGRGRRIDAATLRRAERLFESFQELLFEPWMERTSDFGAPGIIEDGRLTLLPPHGNEVDAGGVCRGIVLLPREGAWSLSEDERERIESTCRSVGVRLHAAGFRGPFTIDCWRYRDARGETRFHALGEVNARMSFGLVARAIAERLAGAGAIRSAQGTRLHLSMDEGPRWTGGGTAVPLLLPAAEDPSAAWIETP